MIRNNVTYTYTYTYIYILKVKFEIKRFDLSAHITSKWWSISSRNLYGIRGGIRRSGCDSGNRSGGGGLRFPCSV